MFNKYKKLKILTEEEFLKQKEDFFISKEIKKIFSKNGYRLSPQAISKIAENIGAKYYYEKLRIILYSKKILEFFSIKTKKGR